MLVYHQRCMYFKQTLLAVSQFSRALVGTDSSPSLLASTGSNSSASFFDSCACSEDTERALLSNAGGKAGSDNVPKCGINIRQSIRTIEKLYCLFDSELCPRAVIDGRLKDVCILHSTL